MKGSVNMNNDFKRFIYFLSLELEEGVSFGDALMNAKEVVKEEEFKSLLDTIAQEIMNGKETIETFKSYENFFPALFVDVLEIGFKHEVELGSILQDYLHKKIDVNRFL